MQKQYQKHKNTIHNSKTSQTKLIHYEKSIPNTNGRFGFLGHNICPIDPRMRVGHQVRQEPQPCVDTEGRQGKQRQPRTPLAVEERLVAEVEGDAQGRENRHPQHGQQHRCT